MSSESQSKKADLTIPERRKLFVPLAINSRQLKPKMNQMKAKKHLHISLTLQDDVTNEHFPLDSFSDVDNPSYEEPSNAFNQLHCNIKMLCSKMNTPHSSNNNEELMNDNDELKEDINL